MWMFGAYKILLLVILLINILCSSMQNNLILVISNIMISNFYTDMLATMHLYSLVSYWMEGEGDDIQH